MTLTTIDESVFNKSVALHASFVLNNTEEREREREREKSREQMMIPISKYLAM